MLGEIRGFNLLYKISFTKEECLFFINMFNVLFTSNMRLFFNTFLHVQVGIFPDPCYGVSSVSHICPVIVYDTMKKFMNLTHLIKLVLQERDVHSL